MELTVHRKHPHENMNFYKLNDSREQLQEINAMHVMTILNISKTI